VTTSPVQLMRAESVRIPRLRKGPGSCLILGASIRDEGLRHPLTLWKDGTLISGRRRLFAHLLMEKRRVPVVFVDTIEEAAKCLQRDNEDDYLALPWKASEICRLWEVLRRLDEPAAVHRGAEAQRRGVELRRQTQSGKRKPGRSSNHSDDYVLSTLGAPFGMSASTAKRLWTIHVLANGPTDAPDDRCEQAREALAEIDAGNSSIWANYQRVTGSRSAPVSRPHPAAPVESASAARQRAAWDKALPQMEGLVAGLVELGPPNPDLTWEQVGPAHARLSAIRREMEKMIKKMRETSQS